MTSGLRQLCHLQESLFALNQLLGPIYAAPQADPWLYERSFGVSQLPSLYCCLLFGHQSLVNLPGANAIHSFPLHYRRLVHLVHWEVWHQFYNFEHLVYLVDHAWRLIRFLWFAPPLLFPSLRWPSRELHSWLTLSSPLQSSGQSYFEASGSHQLNLFVVVKHAGRWRVLLLHLWQADQLHLRMVDLLTLP